MDNQTLVEQLTAPYKPSTVQESPQEEVQTDPEVAEQTQAQTMQQEYQAQNFRTLREQNEMLKRERDEALHLAQEARAIYDRQKAPSQEPQISEDSLVERRHLTPMEKELREQREEVSRLKSQSVDLQLKVQYPDINTIVTTDNFRELCEKHPELGAVVNSTNDYYAKVSAAYTMIKNMKMSSAPQPQSNPQYLREAEMARQNVMKPKPSNAANPQSGSTPMSKANEFAQGLTQEMKDKLWKEMQDSAKRI